MLTETGRIVFGNPAGVDETGQTIINYQPNPGFSSLTETGLHLIAPYSPFVDYFRPVAAQPANQTDDLPGIGWEITLYPEDKDEDTRL